MTQLGIPRIRVLLVEDEQFIRTTIKRMLFALGSQDVKEAADGQSAMTALAGTPLPHLVICDVQMKPIDGLNFLRNLRALPDPVRSKLPVIMLTAVADAATIRSIMDLTVSSYLLKPVSTQRLADRINAIF